MQFKGTNLQDETQSSSIYSATVNSEGWIFALEGGRVLSLEAFVVAAVDGDWRVFTSL